MSGDLSSANRSEISLSFFAPLGSVCSAESVAASELFAVVGGGATGVVTLLWIYTKKVDTKQDFILHFSKHKGGMVSMTHRPYDEDFKKSIVALYQNGKTQSQLSKEYGVSLSAIGKWIRLYSEVKTVDGDIMTAKQIKDLQRRNAQLEEENLILKKAIAIFTPHSNND